MSEQAAYKRWYDKNKGALAARRKLRYVSDAAYRQKALKNAENYRRRRVAPKPPEGYTLTLTAVAALIEVSAPTLTKWMEANLFPRALEHRRRYYFTPSQAGALATLAKFMKEHSRRMTPEASKDLENLSELIFANWE